MLCFGIEDELKIFRKFLFNNSGNFNKNGEAEEKGEGKENENENEIYEKNKDEIIVGENTEHKEIEKVKEVKEVEDVKKVEDVKRKENETNVEKEDSFTSDKIVKRNKNIEVGKNIQKKNTSEFIVDDEVIYMNTSICNSFIFIITKYCIYIFDNSDFSFINLSVLKNEKVEKYGFYEKVFLSSVDNTIYIISENLRYVYAYYISNKEDVLVLDSKKNTFRMNIGESIDENSTEDENEYYDYITYIKNIYKKKNKKCKHVNIKLITMLYLPIISNCLMVTKNNILFFSYESDEIFISDSIQHILTTNTNIQKPKSKQHKVVIDTKIVSLRNVLIKTNKGLNKKIHKNIKKKKQKKRRRKLSKGTFDILELFKGEIEKKGSTTNHVRIKKDNKHCVDKKQTKETNDKNTEKIVQMKQKEKKGETKKKRENNTPYYLYSADRDNSLYEFIIKNKGRESKKKYSNRISIQGIEKVEFNSYNDYLALLSNTGDLYIFSFFHKFFNFPKKKCCYYSGKNIHKKIKDTKRQKIQHNIKDNKQKKENEENRKNIENRKNKENRKNIENRKNKSRNKKRKKNVMGLFVASDTIDFSINIYKKIILLIDSNFVIKGYNIHPYICKHCFYNSLFTIDLWKYNTIYYYNFVIWNKQYNFFLISFNKNDYVIFNSNGSFYYPVKSDTLEKRRNSSSHEQELKLQTKRWTNLFDDLERPGLESNTLSVIQEQIETSVKNTPDEASERESNTKTQKCMDFNILIKREKKRKRCSINICFVFNDFKLFSIKHKDQSFFYIHSKNIYYFVDNYSINKAFHYNSNYYTNGTFHKLYMGFNNLILLKANMDTYSGNDYEQNWAYLEEIKTPFKFMKKVYLNFENTFLLIIFKNICIYNIYRKTFSYFVDDHLTHAYHNYPVGWINNDTFFVACVRSRYDDFNLKESKNNYTKHRSNIKLSTGLGIGVFHPFRLFRKNTYSETSNTDEQKEHMGNADDTDENDNFNENSDSTAGSLKNKKNRNKENISEADEVDINRHKMNYLFNWQHSENDNYFKFFEEYFNMNKCNIYTKPFSLFYKHFFLNKEENVFLINFLKQHRNYQKKKNTEKKEQKEKHLKEETERNTFQRRSLNYFNSSEALYGNEYFSEQKKDWKNGEGKKNEGYTKRMGQEETNTGDDDKKKEKRNKLFTFLSDSSTSLSDDVYEYNTMDNVHKTSNVSEMRNISGRGDPKKNRYLLKNEKKEKRNIGYDMSSNYDDLIEKYDFHYIIYFYSVKNILKFTNYIGYIKLLYRPILTHVYHEGKKEKEDFYRISNSTSKNIHEHNTNRYQKKRGNTDEEKANKEDHSFLIILDAFYNLLCFKITKEKHHIVEHANCLKTKNIFMLPLNRDNNFQMPSAFYTLFDIYNYVFFNFDNTVTFLHIYKNYNSGHWDFELTNTIPYHFDYIEIIKKKKTIFYYSLPMPIQHIWPLSFYYIHLLYSYLIYALYKMNYKKDNDYENLLLDQLVNWERDLKEKEKQPFFFDNDFSKEIKRDQNKYMTREHMETNSTISKNSSGSYMFETKKDFFGSPVNNFLSGRKCQIFEKIFRNKLNKHSQYYKNIFRLIKTDNIDIGSLLKLKGETILLFKNLAGLIWKMFRDHRVEVNSDNDSDINSDWDRDRDQNQNQDRDSVDTRSKEKTQSEVLEIELEMEMEMEIKQKENKKSQLVRSWRSLLEKENTPMDSFERAVSSLLCRILKKNKNVIEKINSILKYSLYHIPEEIDTCEDACYIYLSKKGRMDVISVSKCANKFLLFEELEKENFFMGHNKYTYADLFIYRYMKLKKCVNQRICNIQQTIHNRGVFLSYFLRKLEKTDGNDVNYGNEGNENKKEVENMKEKQIKNDRNDQNDHNDQNRERSICCDKITYQANTYIDLIWLRYLRLYASIFSAFSTKRKFYDDSLLNKENQKRLKNIIVHIMRTYIKKNSFVINILDMVLYKSLYTLNNSYMLLYKFVFQFSKRLSSLTDANGKQRFKTIVGTCEEQTILNITIIILYTFFLPKNKRKRENYEFLKKIILKEIISKGEQATTDTDFYLDVKIYAGLENGKKNDTLKKGINAEHIYTSILYLLFLKKEIGTNNYEQKKRFDIESEYLYKINSNVYYVVLYLLCVIKKKSVFHLYTLLHIFKKYGKQHFSEIIVSIIRKMEPYVSAVLIYAIGNFMPHYFMKNSIQNQKYHVASLYMVNVQNYIGIYNVRKFYCIYFFLLTLRYNITFSKKMIHYLSLVFYHLFKKEHRDIYYWNFLQLPIPNNDCWEKTNRKRNTTDFWHLLLSAYHLNNSKSKHIHNIHDLQFCFDKLLKRRLLSVKSNAAINEKQFHIEEETFIHSKPFDDCRNGIDKEIYEKRKKNTLQVTNKCFQNSYELRKRYKNDTPNIKIQSFIAKHFQMNKIIYEFFYSEDIINVIMENIQNFRSLHSCVNSVFFRPKEEPLSEETAQLTLLKQEGQRFTKQEEMKLKTTSVNMEREAEKEEHSMEKNEMEKTNAFHFDKILNIYVYYIAVIQNTVCYYISNMLWFELFYFVTHLKIDILSFFSYSYFFKSNVFQNVIWGICPIDVAQYARNVSEKTFFHLKQQKNSKTSYQHENKEHGHWQTTTTGDGCSQHRESDCSESYSNKSYSNISYSNKSYGNKSYSSDVYGNEEYSSEVYSNKSYSNKSYSNKSSSSELYNSSSTGNLSSESVSNSKTSNDSLSNASGDHEQKKNRAEEIDHMKNDKYANYVNNVKYMNDVYHKIERERERIENCFEKSNKTNMVSFIDICQSFKRHFDLKYEKPPKVKNIAKSLPLEEDPVYLERGQIKKKRKKYKKNIFMYNIYNTPTDYTFLETYFPPSMYAYIPVYNTIKYMFLFYKICNKNDTMPKKELHRQIKKRIYEYITDNIIDLTKKKKKKKKMYEKEKNKSIIVECTIYKQDIIWFLLKIFILLKLPIHAMALVIYCKNYVLLNILLTIFPYLTHVVNYVMNMNTLHFSYTREEQKKEPVVVTGDRYQQDPQNNKSNFILTDKPFNEEFCEYCYKDILNYGTHKFLPFSNKILERVYKKKCSNTTNNLYDHFLSCECLDNLIFLKKKLLRVRKNVSAL